MTKTSSWENIYSRGEQLNKYPYTDVVSFGYRHWGADGGRGKHVLDVGCGSGIHSKFFADLGAKVLGIDFSASVIEHAKREYECDDIDFTVADLATFESTNRNFDLVVDRCSTTHTTPDITRALYQEIKNSLNPGAIIFWQGFAWDNSGRAHGVVQSDGSWTDFSKGIFRQLGRTTFFKREDLNTIFAGYSLLNLRHLTDKDTINEESHTSWILELKYE